MARNKMHNGLSWRRSLPDFRDFSYAAKLVGETVAPAPDSMLQIDLSSDSLPIWDQEDFGACTIFGSTFMQVFCEMKEGQSYREPAWLQAYWNMRAIDKSGANNDAGGTGRDALKALNYWGVADLSMWAYDEKHFALDPTPDVVTAGEKHKVETYYSLNQSLNELAHCLQQGYPFGFGMSVYESFMQTTGDTGICELPEAGEAFEGGHFIACVGIDMPKKMLKIRNSWNTSWGNKGFFEMPFAYVLDPNLVADLWTVRSAA